MYMYVPANIKYQPANLQNINFNLKHKINYNNHKNIRKF